ncbi:MAG: ATP-binding cassette domain-containing protein [Peptococcaceae bacterium]|nr:ATP-binding cassette domain-containing protein [Peptococcaceae bacterium]
MAQYILEAVGVEFAYPDGTRALKGVSMGIEKGKKVAVLGPNGAGKSTVFLHFNGILRPGRGRIRFAGKDVRYDHASLMELRKNVGIVFQDPDTQLFSASVFQEISFGPLNLGLPREQVEKRVREAMAATEITALAKKPTHLLSYGQKKRVSIADILAMEPAVIICDEPTAWLDPGHSRQVLELFERISRQGTTIVMSTHDVDTAFAFADYIFVMNDGCVVGEGAPQDVFQNEALLKAADLEKPWLIDVYQRLKEKGWVNNGAPPPRTREELLALIPPAAAAAAGPAGDAAPSGPPRPPLR